MKTHIRALGLIIIAIAIFTAPVAMKAADSTTPAGPDFAALENTARAKVADALKSGKDLQGWTSFLDTVVRARYLSAAARLSEKFADVADGFAPQIAALPELIKRAIPMAMKNDSTSPIAIQVVTQFLSAKTAADAQMACGDMLRLIPAMNAADKVRYGTYNDPKFQKKDGGFDEAKVAAATKAEFERVFAELKAFDVPAAQSATIGK